MFYATRKTDNVTSIIVFDCEDCTCDIITGMVGDRFVLTPQHTVDNEVVTTSYTLDNAPLARGQILTISGDNITSAEVFKLCRFYDTQGGYTLIKQQAIGVIGDDVNGGGYPSKLTLSNGDVVSMGEWVRIDKSGNSSKCDVANYKLHQQAAD